jgi:hypothetical protein
MIVDEQVQIWRGGDGCDYAERAPSMRKTFLLWQHAPRGSNPSERVADR